MVKLADLISGVAAALQVSEARVRTAAAQLRKHRLITTGPRGPGAPHMGPTDAANLLLAVMYDDELSVAHESVARLRSASLKRCKHRVFGEAEPKFDELPRNSFLAPENEPLLLGEVLDTMLDCWVRHRGLDEGDDKDLDLSVINLRFEVSRPGYLAQIHYNTHEGFWNLTYEWKPPEQLAYEEANKGKRLVTRWDALNGPHLWSSRTVGDDCLALIADKLRGFVWDSDDIEMMEPPYSGAELSAALADPQEVA
jgi:hypothetical protein